MRWTGKPLAETSLILEAGGVGTLRYDGFKKLRIENGADKIQLRAS